MRPPAHFQCVADLHHLAALRQFVREQAPGLGVSVERLSDVLTALDEVATNVIMHGYRGAPGTLEVIVQRADQHLTLCLRDHAPPFDPLLQPAPDLTLPLHQRPLGKMGIHLARTLMDDVRYTLTAEGHNELTLVKKISQEKPMHLIVEQNHQGRVPVTLLRLQGDLDAATYQGVIGKGQELYAAGTRHLLVDMSGVAYMGSSGLVALHSLVLMMRGASPPDPESGWRAFRAISEDTEHGPQHQVRLLNPQAQTVRVLENTGLNQFFETYTDETAAINAFE